MCVTVCVAPYIMYRSVVLVWVYEGQKSGYAETELFPRERRMKGERRERGRDELS